MQQLSARNDTLIKYAIIASMERLTEVVRANGDKTAEGMTNEILEAVREFTQGAPQFDDLTLMVVKRNP